jgi:hypothetical protein
MLFLEDYMRTASYAGTLIAAIFVLLACEKKVPTQEYADFSEVELAINQLMENEAYQEALTLLESSSARFPEHDYEVQSYARFLYARPRNLGERVGERLFLWGQLPVGGL